HERWEIESAYYALRHTLLDGHVLRSGDQSGLEQETWALLTLYQLLRMAMVDAIEAQPGTDPDRASFTSALEAARDQLTAAAGIRPDDPPAPRRHPRDRHHHAHPPDRPGRAQPHPILHQGTTPGSATDPAAAHHRDHDQPAPTGMERSRTRPAPAHQAPQHAHPARRMGQTRLLHPHRPRHLCAQHAEPSLLDNRPRPLTTRH